ncbi:uncharacterized protein ARMOST_02351 [Armillaria ostoyae]|uniref:Uncharacterized protein n=1 Tax=Armillaria ostoyae TaxID=47428 RepID=A0A284QRH4_ARMOS|nr:uncharacterized protein ARMOST_02351 [Armillaria ostoyae]
MNRTLTSAGGVTLIEKAGRLSSYPGTVLGPDWAEAKIEKGRIPSENFKFYPV